MILNEDFPPVPLPPGYTGPVHLPNTGRQVYWTGRVAIGLRYEQPHRYAIMSADEEFFQSVLLASKSFA